jgi:hypothetical protein
MECADLGSTLEKIVILKHEADGDKGLPALMRALFPEGDVVSVSRRGDGRNGTCPRNAHL